MRNDAAHLEARASRTGRGSSFFPSSFRVISSCLKSVSGNATSIASTVCSAGVSAASSISRAEDDRQREQVQWAGFDKLELGAGNIRHVLLLTYKNGFQVWDVEEADDVQELVSRRDGSVAFLQLQPQPITSVPSHEGFEASRPLLLVVTGDGAFNGGNIQGGFCTGYYGTVGSPPLTGSSHSIPTVVQFYSFRSHTYVHILKFRSAICSIRCSSKIVAVALATQVYCFDASTLQGTFSVLTYPMPQAGQGLGGVNVGYGPMDVGPRWLAYAANHALVQNTGHVSPQHLTPSPGSSPSTSPGNGSLVTHYAKESSKQIAAGLVTLGDMGYKKLTRYYSELFPDDSSSSGSGSVSSRNSSNGFTGLSYEPEYAGTVIVRDFVSKTIVAQFRAHTSPLSALCFDHTGTLIATASIHGHNLNVYRIIPRLMENGLRPTGFDANTSYVHLYKLNRGLTNAVIQDISFSNDSHWIAVSSSRGTSHLFAISPFGGVVTPHTHGGGLVDGSMRPAWGPSLTFPWWSSSEPLKANRQAFPPPPSLINLSVVSRIKNGNGGWRSTVSGAAALATGKTNSSSGAVAVLFHDGSHQGLESDLNNCILKDQLWVFSPSGHLIRYAIRPAGATVYCSNSAGMGVGSCGPSQSQDLRVAVEPLQKWDVGRKLCWVEREENIDNLGRGALADEISTGGLEGYRNGTIHSHRCESGRLGMERIITEEKHRWYISNAEMQMHQGRPPIWAKSEICFRIMMFKITSEECYNKEEPGGEIDIEKIPTRVVEVRKTDLVPVFEPCQKFKNLHGARGPVSEIYQLKDECIQEGISAIAIDSAHRQISSSGSSCGSEDSFFGGQAVVLNGFHHAYQGSQEQVAAAFSSDSMSPSGHNPPYSPTFSEKVEIVGSLRKLKLPNQNHNGKYMLLTENNINIGLPPVDIPGSGKGDACNMHAFENFLKVNGTLKSLDILECGIGRQPAKGDVAGNQGVVSGEHIMDGSVPQLGLLKNQGLKFCGNYNSSGMSKWSVGTEGGIDSPCHEVHHEGIPTNNTIAEHRPSGHVILEQGLLRTTLLNANATVVGGTSVGVHSKAGDLEGREHDEDGWEGGMFPFCDEG